VKTFWLNSFPGDFLHLGKGFVIPLPKDRALRIGANFRFHCSLGPRRYRIVMSNNAIRDYGNIMGGDENWARQNLSKMEGVDLQPEGEPSMTPLGDLGKTNA